MGSRVDGAIGDKWQVRNLTTSLSKALRKSCRLGHSDHNSLYARLWGDANPLLMPAISHLFLDHFTKSSRKLKTCTVRKALKLRHGTQVGPSGMPNWPDESPFLGRHLMAGVPFARTWALAPMFLGPAHIDRSKGYILRETMRP